MTDFFSYFNPVLSPWPWIVGGIGAAGVCAGAFAWIVRRRRARSRDRHS